MSPSASFVTLASKSVDVEGYNACGHLGTCFPALNSNHPPFGTVICFNIHRHQNRCQDRNTPKTSLIFRTYFLRQISYHVTASYSAKPIPRSLYLSLYFHCVYNVPTCGIAPLSLKRVLWPQMSGLDILIRVSI